MHPPQVIKLSDAIQPLPRAVTQFVHGVAKPFLATGERLAARRGQTLSMAVDDSQTQDAADQGKKLMWRHFLVSTPGGPASCNSASGAGLAVFCSVVA